MLIEMIDRPIFGKPIEFTPCFMNNNHILLVTAFKIPRLIFLEVLKVFGEPIWEPNEERRVKI